MFGEGVRVLLFVIELDHVIDVALNVLFEKILGISNMFYILYPTPNFAYHTGLSTFPTMYALLIIQLVRLVIIIRAYFYIPRLNIFHH